jgi:hypothetical protein
MKNFNP